MAADGYRFHRSYHDALKGRSAEERLALFDAMNAFAFDGVDTEFEDPNLAMAWDLIRPNIDSSLKRSQTNANNARGGKAKATDKAIAKTIVKTTGKTTAQANGKATDETTAKAIVSPESIGKEGIGEEVFLPIGKEEIPSSVSGTGDTKAALSLPKGWERTGVSCGYHRGTSMLRSPDGETICPKCSPDKIPPELMGVVA